MPQTHQSSSRRLLAAVLLLALGVAPVLVQTGAWGVMLVEYSRAASFTTAVGMTFDGRHPCAMCRKVQEHEQDGQRQESLPVTRDTILLFHDNTMVQIAPLEAISPPRLRGHDAASLITRRHQPPVPPPRSWA